MSECVFALIQLNLINDRKEMGERKKERSWIEIEGERKGKTEHGGRGRKGGGK